MEAFVWSTDRDELIKAEGGKHLFEDIGDGDLAFCFSGGDGERGSTEVLFLGPNAAAKAKKWQEWATDKNNLVRDDIAIALKEWFKP